MFSDFSSIAFNQQLSFQQHFMSPQACHPHLNSYTNESKLEHPRESLNSEISTDKLDIDELLYGKNAPKIQRLRQALDTIDDNQLKVEKRLQSRFDQNETRHYDDKVRRLADYRISLIKALTEATTPEEHRGI